MIEFDRVRMSFGAVTVLDGLSFTARNGAVTGLVGPNGAGKSTAFKILLGLLPPDAGTATVDGRPYSACRTPASVLGAFLGARGIPSSMSGIGYLRYICDLLRVPSREAGERLSAVGLADNADLAVRAYSLGMRQRLGVAAALLGEPATLVLDEPVNGLDIEGVRWLRDTLRSAADAGRCVLLSSHLLSELELVADDVVMLRSGSAALSGELHTIRESTSSTVRLGTADLAASAAHLRACGAVVEHGADTLLVHGQTVDWVARTAAQLDVPILEIARQLVSLENAYLAQLGGARVVEPDVRGGRG